MSDEKGKQKLSTEPYKGVRDFYPEDQAIENYIFESFARSAESFGYQEYNASPLEPSELYLAKTSKEIVDEQTYTFTDRGGRSVTLRPEMTPTVARMIAKERKSTSFPKRLYSIPNVFRYERPQRGRLREHYQLNVDLFGIATIDAEIEVLLLAHSLLRSFGLKEEDFEIHVNDRTVLNAYLDEIGLDSEKKLTVLRLLDKKTKINDFDTKLVELVPQGIDFENLISKDVEVLIEKLESLGVSNIVYDKTLARGFDYYTGIVFEILDTNPENSRSIFGGGRYDNLLSMFDEEPVPAFGFGVGDVTIKDLLETHNLLPTDINFSDIYIAVLDSESSMYAMRIAQEIRSLGKRVTTDLRFDSLSTQIKRALALGSRWALIIGENERAQNTLTAKNLLTEEQTSGSPEDVFALLN